MVLVLYKGARNGSLSQQDIILLPSSLTKPPPAKSLLLHCHLVLCCMSSPSQRAIHKAARLPYQAVVPPSDLGEDPGTHFLTSGFALFTEHPDVLQVDDLAVSGGSLFGFQ
ncbi:unnamed protein product [Pleuronectes platessa]|uniref:Uncharacterized protein n=1 Tax=Pleuronectes platessa TaxID=8262 RepID=A0A9N7YXX3_PLEPL|nr:unnamed protein product [Pleuronectes platessa]